MLLEVDDDVLLIIVLEVLFKILERIDGTPKHVPITTTQPITPLQKGKTTLLPKPDFDFLVLYMLELVTALKLVFFFSFTSFIGVFSFLFSSI